MNGEYYAIQFANGRYYAGISQGVERVNETDNLNKASLYSEEWEVQRDLYFALYLFGKEMPYEMVKVKAETIITII